MAEADPKGGPGVPVNVAALILARIRKGKSQKELAHFVGIDGRMYERIEKRGTAAVKTLVKIATKLNIDVESLLTSAGLRPSQLPASAADFTGREDEIGRMVSMLTGDEAQSRVLALRGMGGAGKTTLAVKVGHLVKSQYPDGQILIDLLGMTDKPLDPAAVMARVIHDVYPAMEDFPESLAELLAVYRSAMNGKRILLIFDNAKDEEQVLNLVTVAPPVGIIVTSRVAITLDGVESIGVGALDNANAFGLLRRIVKNKGQDDEVCKVAELCGFLPLALRVAGDFIRMHADWSVPQYISALEEEGERLTALKGRTKERDVEAVLGLSARRLVIEDEILAARWQMLTAYKSSFPVEVAAVIWGLRTKDSLNLNRAKKLLTSLQERSLLQATE